MRKLYRKIAILSNFCFAFCVCKIDSNNYLIPFYIIADTNLNNKKVYTRMWLNNSLCIVSITSITK